MPVKHLTDVVGLALELEGAVWGVDQVDRSIRGKHTCVAKTFISVVGNVEKELLISFELIGDISGLCGCKQRTWSKLKDSRSD